MKSRPPSGPSYIDRPEINEVFADRLEHLIYDGVTVRMEFTVTRTEPLNSVPGKPVPEPKQWSYTACRVVLSGRGAVEMVHRMMELQGVLVQQGLIQPRSAPSAAADVPTQPDEQPPG